MAKKKNTAKNKRLTAIKPLLYRVKKSMLNTIGPNEWLPCNEEEKERLERNCPRKFEFKANESPSFTENMAVIEEKE